MNGLAKGPVLLILFVAATLLSLPVSSQSSESRLVFKESGQKISSLTPSGLADVVRPTEIEIFNPLMNKNKRYLAVELKTLLDAVYGTKWYSPRYSDIAFKALDSYEAVANLQRLREDGAYLAYEDLDRANGWEPIGHKLADPGPFFLVWANQHQTTANAYPWPWQVAAIDLLRFEHRYPAVVPRGSKPGSPERLGFELFRSRCLRCHAMNRQGGKVGPDLNAPQSIVAYRSEKMIKSYIRQASKFRYTQMPDHPDLTDLDLDNLYRYFKHQDQHRYETDRAD